MLLPLLLLTALTNLHKSKENLASDSIKKVQKAAIQNKNIFAWPSLQEKYWEGHDLEPFAEYWKYPSRLNRFDWTQSYHYATSISCPYFKDGKPQVPEYLKFIETALLHCEVEVAIIGRDVNILEFQQKRVRGMETTGFFLEQLEDIYSAQTQISFISQELLYLYKGMYLERVANDLDWPIAFWDPEVEVILEKDANRKYVKRAEEYWLDFEVQKAVKDS